MRASAQTHKTYRLGGEAMEMLEQYAESEDRPYAKVLADAMKLYDMHARAAAKGHRIDKVDRRGVRTKMEVIL